MPNSIYDINSYTLSAYPELIDEDVLTVRDFTIESRPQNIWSTLFWDFNIYDCRRKEPKIAEILSSIAGLKENWDNEGAPSINEEVVNSATAIIYIMEAAGESLYSIAPGPRSEVMLDFRTNGKSLEIIIYPDQMKFVKFSDTEQPKQGKFTYEILPSLISWLNN